MQRVDDYTSGGREAFLASTLIQDAVVRNLQVLAESTQRLSEELKATFSAVDWKGISGFRNVLVHNYLGVDVERVWLVIENHVASLTNEMAAMLAAVAGTDDSDG